MQEFSYNLDVNRGWEEALGLAGGFPLTGDRKMTEEVFFKFLDFVWGVYSCYPWIVYYKSL